ncbi:MAG: Ig-like domain-containing protein [Bacteroidetes bacterium]|nr:Ig-like domain-containing protein [Bacteroidota bacterium]
MKKVCVLILLNLFFFKLQAQNFDWVKEEGLYAYDYGYGISTDIVGNIYISGKYEMNANFSDSILTSYGNHDIYLAKYNSTGALIWTRTAGGIYGDYAHALACDGLSYVYVAGEIEGFETQINFQDSPITLNSTGSNDAFLSKYDLNGNLIWAKHAGGYYDDEALGITYDLAGNVYICGFFTDTATFSGTTIYGRGNRDIFIAKYDTDGNFLWVNQAGSDGRDEAKAIKCDSYGNVYLTGMYEDSALFDSSVLLSPLGYFNIFLAKYASDGSLIWVKNSGGDYDDVAWAITLDNADKIYIAGEFNASAYFDSIQLITTGQGNIFVACYNNSGNIEWVTSAGGPLVDRARGIGCDGTNIYITGQFSMSANFGAYTVTGIDSSEIFMAKINNTGGFEWAISVGGSHDVTELLGYESGNGICAEASGNVYATGALINGGVFGNTTLFPYSRTDIFLTKISQGPDITAPLAPIFDPLNNMINVPNNSNLVLSFNEVVQKGAGNVIIKEDGLVTQSVDVTGANVIVNGNLVTIDPGNFTPGSSVNVEMTSGVFKDLANNNYLGISDELIWRFSISAATLVSNYYLINNFSIYPNPSQGNFTINSNLPDVQKIEITITNTIGQIIDKKIYKYNSHLIVDLSAKKKGIYFIEIKTNDQSLFREKILYQ